MKICEMFRSIQGEGRTIGKVTYFVRTVGCNLMCEWCDTKFSYDGGYDLSVDEIMDAVRDERNICVTGGEPLLQKDIYELLDALVAAGKHVVLETNGSLDISKVPARADLVISMDMKCPSSGMSNRMIEDNVRLLKRSDQLKFIIVDREDLEHAVSFIDSHDLVCDIILSPAGGIDVIILAEEAVRRGLDVRVLPQLHKIIWGDRRSV
ncbi:MAG: radical SAM protein [Methanomassiliicoccaceae archaeon]|nr:radical SAM protein [Methanomassiliicoccaceae archaeon]